MKHCFFQRQTLEINLFQNCSPHHGRIYREANEALASGPHICTDPFQDLGGTLNKYSLFVPNFVLFFLNRAPNIA
jgi:hypothetical protein